MALGVGVELKSIGIKIVMETIIILLPIGAMGLLQMFCLIHMNRRVAILEAIAQHPVRWPVPEPEHFAVPIQPPQPWGAPTGIL